MNALSTFINDGITPLIQSSETDLMTFTKCPVTVGEYPSIFSYYSLRAPSHLRNFTLQTPRISPV